MKNSEILIVTFLIVESLIICYFFYIYTKNEKLNKIQRETELKEMKQIILNEISLATKNQETKITEILIQQKENFQNQNQNHTTTFEEMQKAVMITQKQSTDKINNGIDLLVIEISKIQKEIYANLNKIDSSNNNFIEKINEIIIKFSDDIKKSKLDANKLKEEMQQDLKSILMEIKAPLDLE